MLYRLFLILVLFSLNVTNTTAQEKALNPIQNASLESSILFQPQEFIEDEKNVSELFLSAVKNTPLIAPLEGTISNFGIDYYYSLTYVKGDRLSATKTFQSQKNDFVNELKDINPKYVNASVTVVTKDGLKYHIAGFTPKTILKSGDKIQKGQVLGYVGFSYHKINTPCIMMSVSRNQKSIDPLTIFGLKSKFVKNSFEDYATKKHSSLELIAALNIIKESLEEGHPGLYDYATKNTIDSLFNAIRTHIMTPITSEDFRFLLTPLFGAIGDSHLTIHGQGGSQMPPFPPVMFGLENGAVKTFVALKGYEKYLHKELVEINGEPSKSIVQKLKHYILESDGYIQSVKDEMLMLYMPSFYSQKYRVKAGDSLEFRFADNTTAKFTWKMLGNNDRFYPKFNYKNKKYRYKTSLPAKNVALLEIRTFHLLETDKDSIKNFIKTIENSKCKNLIIDLRDNQGGESNNLFSMVARKPFQSMIYTKVMKQHYSFFKYTSNYNFPDSDMFEGYTKKNDGYYAYTNSYTPINDSINFTGNLYVLTNSNTKSASTLFAALVHKYKRGVIIGQECGTTYHQMNAVKFASVIVGNTGLTMRMPLVKLVFDNPENSDIPWGRGVIPDYQVDVRFEDYFSSEDRILAFTLDLIENQNSVH